MDGSRSIPALSAPPAPRDNPLTRSVAGLIGLAFLALVTTACLGTLPYTLGRGAATPEQFAAGMTVGSVRYDDQHPREARLPPFWCYPVPGDVERLERNAGGGSSDAVARLASLKEDIRRYNALVGAGELQRIAIRHRLEVDDVLLATGGAALSDLRRAWPRYWLGTDHLGRSLLARSLAGGGISLGIGLSAAMLSVFIGTFYGALSAYAGGNVDAVMMRIVDILYGLPYVLMVVLLAVAGDAVVERLMVARPGLGGVSGALAGWVLEHRTLADVLILLTAIGGVSWLTMARVIRGQVLSLKSQPFMEAARAVGVPWRRQFTRHLLPNLVGPIVVYATLTVPQAMLQESFLSFLGIGVKPPLPSWGTLASDGLGELNPYKSHWWLLVFPCLLLGGTLLALNFVGEGLREAFDPRRARR
jgi:oligopeptide transport system permease protein